MKSPAPRIKAHSTRISPNARLNQGMFTYFDALHLSSETFSHAYLLRITIPQKIQLVPCTKCLMLHKDIFVFCYTFIYKIQTLLICLPGEKSSRKTRKAFNPINVKSITGKFNKKMFEYHIGFLFN